VIPHRDLRALASGVRLTPSQRRVLGVLLEHAAEAPFLSASELAALAGVSQPSVTRLAHVLGFDGYGALRDELRAPPPAAGTPSDRWGAVLDREAELLHRAAARLPTEPDWSEMGRALRASAPLVVAGVRASKYLASYFCYLAAKVHPAVVEVTAAGPDATEAVTTARDLGATAALVVCMPRYPTATVQLLDVLTRLGYQVLLVSDDAMPPLSGSPPAWHLAVPVGSELTFDGHPAALVLLTMLLDAVCNASPLDAEGRLDRLDAIADEVGTYWRP
jgi:DNA-binding MurR/RpiR family transcriptional regulator